MVCSVGWILKAGLHFSERCLKFPILQLGAISQFADRAWNHSNAKLIRQMRAFLSSLEEDEGLAC